MSTRVLSPPLILLIVFPGRHSGERVWGFFTTHRIICMREDGGRRRDFATTRLEGWHAGGTEDGQGAICRCCANCSQSEGRAERAHARAAAQMLNDGSSMPLNGHVHHRTAHQHLLLSPCTRPQPGTKCSPVWTVDCCGDLFINLAAEEIRSARFICLDSRGAHPQSTPKPTGPGPQAGTAGTRPPLEEGVEGGRRGLQGCTRSPDAERQLIRPDPSPLPPTSSAFIVRLVPEQPPVPRSPRCLVLSDPVSPIVPSPPSLGVAPLFFPLPTKYLNLPPPRPPRAPHHPVPPPPT